MKGNKQQSKSLCEMAAKLAKLKKEDQVLEALVAAYDAGEMTQAEARAAYEHFEMLEAMWAQEARS